MFFFTASITSVPTLKALKELCYISEKTLNEVIRVDNFDYAPLYLALKRLPDNGYEYGYSELLYGLYHGIATGRISGMAYNYVKTMTNKQVFQEIVRPCALALKKADKPFTSGFAWDWMRDTYFVEKFGK
jgi:hypothetical protein